jgi:ribosomal protein L35AE/L33A
MQTKNMQRAMLALFTLAVFLGARQGALAQFPSTAGNDLTPSMGQFSIVVAKNFQPMMVGYPSYNSSTHILVSPVLQDNNTIIGRSAPLHVGDASDIAGLPVGLFGTNVSQAMLTVLPGGLEPVGTREVHTMIYQMNMVPQGVSFGPPAVRGGTNATTQPNSVGEVQSWSGATGLPVNDFPAQSFFDVFVDVDLAAGGTGFPGATNLYNTLPLMIQNTNLTSFPPQVVYIHGMSTAVPIKFSSGPYAGQIFGLLTLAGHGVFPTNNAGTQAALTTALAATIPAPIEPQYSNLVGAPVTLATSNNMIFPVQADDNTTSLGTFALAVNPAFQPYMAGYPGWNATTKVLTSPLLYDPATIIGRSSQLRESSSSDTNGVPVGTANTLVRDASCILVPPLFESPSNTYEVHTELRSMNMTSGGSGVGGGGGFAVRAGIAAPGALPSYGEVESLSGASGDAYWDFPAKSFFDIFVQVDFPAGGGIPTGFTVTNQVPLVVQNNNLTTFPPNVVYVHGNTTAVPVYFTNDVPAIGAHAGDVFGIILLAGHGVNINPSNTTQVAQFQTAVSEMTPEPVAPQYASWAVGLNVPLQISSISLQTPGIVQISGYGTVSNSVTLQSTTNLDLIGGPVWVDEVTTTGTTNSTFTVAPARSTASVKFYRMVDNTR